jgi:hypothetical protein
VARRAVILARAQRCETWASVAIRALMPAPKNAPRSVARSLTQFQKILRERAAGAGYDRARDLPRLLPLWPRELETRSESDHARLLAMMRRALRRERQRGLAGHWTYDLARHAHLLRAYRAEVAAYLHGRATMGAAKHRRARAELDRSLRGRRAQRYFSRRVPSPIFLARSERARA